MMDFLLKFFGKINSVFWGDFMTFVLIIAGIAFTCILRFPQLRRIKDSFILTFGSLGKKYKVIADEKGMSSWQSLMTAVSGQVGTGNIAGPATAIMSGGPGAIFWMWLAAFFGMGTIFAEATAAQKYKATLPDGTVTGGPAYYIKAAFPNRFGVFLAGFFSVAIVIGFAMAAAMIQGNTVCGAIKTSFHVPVVATALLVGVLLLMVVIGGMGRIARTVEKMVPAMAIIYLVTAIIVILAHASQIPAAFAMIFKHAFTGQAAGGAFVGISVRAAMRYGVARGLFSNEAGMGSTPHAHAVAKVKHPCDQGIVAMMSIILDTFIILTISALVILTTGAYAGGQEGVGVIQSAYEVLYGHGGTVIIALCIFFFCFSTILAGYFYGEGNFRRLFGTRSRPVYIVLVIGFLIFGSVAPVKLVWSVCDTFNGLMVLLNLIGLFGVSGILYKVWKDYEYAGPGIDSTLNDIKRNRGEVKSGNGML